MTVNLFLNCNIYLSVLVVGSKILVKCFIKYIDFFFIFIAIFLNFKWPLVEVVTRYDVISTQLVPLKNSPDTTEAAYEYFLN